MITVYKYPVHLANNLIDLPRGAQIIKFDRQGADLSIWAIVDSEVREVSVRNILVAGTGHNLGDKDRSYIGSCLDNPFVWHCFELFEYPEF